MRRGITLTKWIRAIADVAGATIPEVSEIEYRVDHARSIAWLNFSGVDELAGMARVGIREVSVGSGCAVVNAGPKGHRVEVPGKYALRGDDVMMVDARIVRNRVKIARWFI